VITTEAVHTWCLVNGAWVEREDPVMAVCDPCGGDVDAAMAALGYEAWCQVGVGDLPSVPVSLTLYSREEPPLQFLLQLEGNAGNVVEHVFAETLPDAMELLARWAPLARAVVQGGPCEMAGQPGRGRAGNGAGRPENGSGRPGDGPAGPGGGHGRLGEVPGRPWGLGGDRPDRQDHPDRQRPAMPRRISSGPPATVDDTASPGE
jgi:hypothetical protein